jgi:prepilin-type N-terminal cleavage/methylation domain-containing protein
MTGRTRTTLRPKQRFACRRTGFTLVEVMIAVGLLGMTIAGFYAVLTASTRTRIMAHNRYVAVTIANNRIERAKHMRIDELPLLVESGTLVNALGSPNPDGPFVRSTTINPSQNGDPRLTRITVSVQAPRVRRGTTTGLTETVSTLLTEYLDP